MKESAFDLLPSILLALYKPQNIIYIDISVLERFFEFLVRWIFGNGAQGEELDAGDNICGWWLLSWVLLLLSLLQPIPIPLFVLLLFLLLTPWQGTLLSRLFGYMFGYMFGKETESAPWLWTGPTCKFKFYPTCKTKLCEEETKSATGLELGLEYIMGFWTIIEQVTAVSETESNQWGTSKYSILITSVALARSATVSIAAQKAGGDLDQPIGRTKGIEINWLSPFLVGNKTPEQI